MPNTNNFVEFSKPFVDACKKIFTTMLACELEPQKPSLKSDGRTKGDISALIGLAGELEKDGEKFPYKAMLVLSFPYQTYFNIASAMLGEKYSSYEKEIHDLGGELVNMIMGNAKRDLKEMGYTSNMAIPSMIEGSGHTISYPSGTTIVLIPFNSVHGPLYMELCYASFEPTP